MNFFQKVWAFIVSIFKNGQTLKDQNGAIGAEPIPEPVTKPVPSLTMIHGIDVSHYEKVDWKSIKPYQVQFVFLKATEGVSHVDAAFAGFRKGAKEYGIPCGAYHFSRMGDGAAQAKNFCSVVGDILPGELPIVLDWEEREDPVTKEITYMSKDDAQKWLYYVESFYKTVPIIYTNSSFGIERKLGQEFKRYPLWLAHYTKGTPKIPQPWTKYTFWQYSDDEQIAGVGTCDVNYFNGTPAELSSMRKK